MLPTDETSLPTKREELPPPVVLGPAGDEVPNLHAIRTRDVLILAAVIICATGLAIVHVPSVLVLLGGISLGMFIGK